MQVGLLDTLSKDHGGHFDFASYRRWGTHLERGQKESALFARRNRNLEIPVTCEAFGDMDISSGGVLGLLSPIDIVCIIDTMTGKKGCTHQRVGFKLSGM